MSNSSWQEIEAVVCSWALEQVAPWLLQPVSLPDMSVELDRLNASESDIFLISISQGRASILHKPESARSWSYQSGFGRAQWYQGWLTEVAGEYFPGLCATLAVFVGDGTLQDPQVPVFSFQKPVGNRSLLLPDIDLLRFRFPAADDHSTYHEKQCRGVFAGATSGGLVTAERILHDGAIPRIRAALFFRDKPDVSFKLPSVVQNNGDEAAVELLRSFDVGVGEHVPWSDQLHYRFILSMDGNGATCSRIAIALSSNSILVKYESPHVLYYFSGLKSWLHFIPIDKHDEVLKIIDVEKKTPGFFQPVAEAGTEFWESYLNPRAARRYTAELLKLYANFFYSTPPRNTEKTVASFDILAHVQGQGDLEGSSGDWVGVQGSRLTVEGFALWPCVRMDARDLKYQALNYDGTLSLPVDGGYFSGTRGQALPLKGFRIWLEGEAARHWRCLCWATFLDGVEIGPVEAGEVCHSPQGGYLESMRVVWLPTDVADIQ